MKRSIAIRARVFCSFLALILRKELADRVQKADVDMEWEPFKRDLDDLEEMRVIKGEKEFIIRTDTKGEVGKVLQAVGVQPPKKIRKAQPEEG